MHQPSETQQTGTRPPWGHPSTSPQQMTPIPVPVISALQPLGQQDPEKANPSLHTQPRTWPLRAAPIPASNTQGSSRHYQEATVTNRTSGTSAMLLPPREGPVRQPQAAKGWGAQGHAPPLRLPGHPNLHPWATALLLPHKAPAGAPASLPMPMTKESLRGSLQSRAHLSFKGMKAAGSGR